MPFIHKQWRWVRGLQAVSLSVLFCLLSLAPLAAASAAGASHCGSLTKCCCRKAHRTNGPAISTRACQSHCGQMAPVSGGVTAGTPAHRFFDEPVLQARAALHLGSQRADTAAPSESLRQRPPPSPAI